MFSCLLLIVNATWLHADTKYRANIVTVISQTEWPTLLMTNLVTNATKDNIFANK